MMMDDFNDKVYSKEELKQLSVEKENIHNGLNYCHDLFYRYIGDCNNIKIESHEGIVFDLNEYPDINIDDFERHLLKYFNKYFDKLLYDKYRVYFTFYRDSENNTVTVTADIQDWSCIHEPDPELDKMFRKIVEKRQELELMEKQVINVCDRYEELLTDISLEITGILDSELSDGIDFDTYKFKDYIKHGIVKSVISRGE